MRLMTLGVLVCSALLAADADRVENKTDKDAVRRLQDSADVFNEIMATPDKGIPRDLLDKSWCVAIVPGLKQGAFIVGAKYGRGFMSCREPGRHWSPPAAIRVEGGSFGFQIGGSETDVVMLVMNQRGVNKLLSSQFTLGGEGEVAAGPIGRTATAQTDAKLTAEILSWSRSRGVFAGIALTGATLRQDLDVNEALYGKHLDSREIVKSKVTGPPAAAVLRDALMKYSPVQKSDSGSDDTRRK